MPECSLTFYWLVRVIAGNDAYKRGGTNFKASDMGGSQ